MDYSQVTLMRMMQQKMAYHSERQDQISRNIANVDTPGYRPKDLAPLEFDDVLRAQRRLQMVRTAPEHSEGSQIRMPQHEADIQKQYFERKPVGNAVSVEEQMRMMNENAFDFQTTTSLYNKTTSLFRNALGEN